jgi:hypothetical protein
MINSQNFVFSPSSAARILRVKTHLILGFQKWWKVCWIWVKGRRPIFMSLKVFREHFVSWRKEQSKSLCVSREGSQHFQVINSKKSTAYTVWTFQDGLDCECEDFKNQVIILGKACCKHCYSVLNYLGFDRLSDYIEHHRWLQTS